MAKIRCIQQYNISKHRFGELYNFCLQYSEWKDELKYKTHTVGSPEITDMPKGSSSGDATADLAERRVFLQRKCEQIEQAAMETDIKLSRYILKAVTEDLSFTYLKMVMGIPCSHNTYYDRRRKFFWILAKKCNNW